MIKSYYTIYQKKKKNVFVPDRSSAKFLFQIFMKGYIIVNIRQSVCFFTDDYHRGKLTGRGKVHLVTLLTNPGSKLLSWLQTISME